MIKVLFVRRATAFVSEDDPCDSVGKGLTGALVLIYAGTVVSSFSTQNYIRANIL